MKRFSVQSVILASLVSFCAFAQPAFAQSADATAVSSAKGESMKREFPVPGVAEGAELLRYEGVMFEAETTPMPEVAATVRSARKNKDLSSMFITHMMYRDNIGDIAFYNEGKKQDAELSEISRHREMIRWRYAAADEGYELAILATSPSVQYEISPMFSNDDEFKKGLSWLKKAAAHGYGNAEYILGLVYFNGVGAKRDKKKGFELLVRAAAHGVVNAYYAVGMIYEMELNGKKDTGKSLYWLEKAAKLGSNDAIFILMMKYIEGIDVPKDEAKAAEIANLDTKYHAWTMLLSDYYGMFSHRYCTEKYDQSDIGRTDYKGGCESHVDYYDRFGSYDNDYDDEEKKESPDEVASYSLDYKIDYRLASLWLKKIATFDREKAYILRAQTHHLTGCRGSLDGDDYGEIDISPHEASWDDYDNYPLSYKKIVIALHDYKDKPAKLRKWLIQRADDGDRDALLTLAILYDQSNYGISNVNDNYYHYGDEISGVDYDDDKVEKIEETLGEELGFYKKETRSEVKKNLPKAFAYYEKGNFYASAIRDAELLGSDLKNSNYDRIPKGKVTIDWFEKAFVLSEKGYQHYMHANDFENARKFAERAADIMRKLDKKTDAMTWYVRALEVNEKVENQTSMHGLFRFKNSLELARLYQDGTDSNNNQAGKTIYLYKDVLHSVNSLYYQVTDERYEVADVGKMLNDIAMDLLDTAVRLGEMSEHAKSNHSGKQASDKILTVEAYQRASELAYYISSLDNKDIKFKDAIVLARKHIEDLPKYDLQKEVEKQILAEKGKNADKFYIFDKVLSPCDKEADNREWDDGKYLYCAYEVTGDGEDWCSYRTCRIDDPYQESINTVIVALTAFSLANGTLDIEKIKNTFYDLAIYKTWLRLSSGVSASSAVYQKLGEHLRKCADASSDYTFNDYDKNKVYHIWYLRQIPYAAADKFKKLKSDKKWDEYMQEAKEIVQNTPELRNAFGYDPAKPVQRFHY